MTGGMTAEDAALAIQVLEKRAAVCCVPGGREALGRAVNYLRMGRDDAQFLKPKDAPDEPYTLKTDWVAPGAGETAADVAALLGVLLEGTRAEERTALRFVRSGLPLRYDLERAAEALRRIGVGVDWDAEKQWLIFFHARYGATSQWKIQVAQ